MEKDSQQVRIEGSVEATSPPRDIEPGDVIYCANGEFSHSEETAFVLMYRDIDKHDFSGIGGGLEYLWYVASLKLPVQAGWKKGFSTQDRGMEVRLTESEIRSVPRIGNLWDWIRAALRGEPSGEPSKAIPPLSAPDLREAVAKYLHANCGPSSAWPFWESAMPESTRDVYRKHAGAIIALLATPPSIGRETDQKGGGEDTPEERGAP